MTKEEKGYPKEQHSLIIMDTFKGQDNDTLKELCSENKYEIVIVPHNLTNKFQPLHISINKAAKAYIKNSAGILEAVTVLDRGFSIYDFG